MADAVTARRETGQHCTAKPWSGREAGGKTPGWGDRGGAWPPPPAGEGRGSKCHPPPHTPIRSHLEHRPPAIPARSAQPVAWVEASNVPVKRQVSPGGWREQVIFNLPKTLACKKHSRSTGHSAGQSRTGESRAGLSGFRSGSPHRPSFLPMGSTAPLTPGYRGVNTRWLCRWLWWSGVSRGSPEDCSLGAVGSQGHAGASLLSLHFWGP